MNKYFLNDNEEAIIVQAIQMAKNNYSLIEDCCADNSIKKEMEKRIKILNHFLTRTIS